MDIVQLVGIGLVAGVVSGLFGVGGGLVIVPGLLLMMKMNLHDALGTSLGALVLPVGLLGVIEYWRHQNIDIKYALIIAAGLFIGTYIGAKIVQPISPIILRRVYAAFLVFVAFKLAFLK
jgi:hypothetical protein